MSPAITATLLVIGIVVAVALLVSWVLMCARIRSLWLAMPAALSPVVLIAWVGFFGAAGGFE